jgi:hypothetical protein
MQGEPVFSTITARDGGLWVSVCNERDSIRHHAEQCLRDVSARLGMQSQVMTNPHASALGKLAKGKKKTLTNEQREQKRKVLAELRKKRWSGRPRKQTVKGKGE